MSLPTPIAPPVEVFTAPLSRGKDKLARHLRLQLHPPVQVFTAPLARGEDKLAELPFPHANFHLPEVKQAPCGNAKMARNGASRDQLAGDLERRAWRGV